VTDPTPQDGAAPPDTGEIQGRVFLVMIGVAALIGIPAALVAAALLGAIHELQHLLWEVWPESLGLDTPPWWMLLALPVAGALLVWAARVLLPGDGGHEPLDGLSVAPTPVRFVPSIAAAAIASLAFGAVLGPEAPLIALGSATGVVAARAFRLPGQGRSVVALAGSFSAVSAVFGGPLIAGVLMLEAGIAAGASLIPALLPGLVGAAIGYTLFLGIGEWAGIPTQSLTVPGLSTYSSVRILDLVLAIVVGVVVVLLVHVVRGIAGRVSALRPRLGTGPTLLLGALLLGGVAITAEALGANGRDVLFSGQESLPDLLATTSVPILLVLVVAKCLGYALCLGAGFRGGPVFPAIFIGVATAMLLVEAVGMSPTVALAIGTACGVTAFTRLVFTALVFAGLMVGPAGGAAVSAAVLAAASAWVTAAVLDKRSNVIPDAGPSPDAA
jgi:H+/Cl- antiporter ClcA